MLSKKEVKDIQSLGHKKNRDAAGLFLAEGPKIVTELVQLIPDQIEKVIALPEWAAQHQEGLKDFSVTEVSEKELQRISQFQTPHDVVAVIKHFRSERPEIKNSFCLYLDTIQDPGNFGTIIRIADWFGIPDIVCSSGCVDLYNPKVVQSTMASIARVNVYYDKTKTWLSEQQVPVYAAVLDGRSVYEHAKTSSGILIIGNESKGIDDVLVEKATERITIPKKGAAESLNAAVATGIILSHLLHSD